MQGKKKTADRVELLSAVEKKEIGKQQQLHCNTTAINIQCFIGGLFAGIALMMTIARVADRGYQTVGGEQFLLPLTLFLMSISNKIIIKYCGKEEA